MNDTVDLGYQFDGFFTNGQELWFRGNIWEGDSETETLQLEPNSGLVASWIWQA